MTFLLAIRGATFLGATAACDASSIHTSRRLSLRIPRHETNPWNLPRSHQNHLVHPPPLRARSPERQVQPLMRKRLEGDEQPIHLLLSHPLPVSAGLLADNPPLLKLRVTGLSEIGRVVASFGASWVAAVIVVKARGRKPARLIADLSFSSPFSPCWPGPGQAL